MMTSAAVLLALWAGAAEAEAPKSPAELFVAKCSKCHGKDGKGNDKVLKLLKTDLPSLDLTDADSQAKKDEEHLKVVTDGVKKMPAYKEKLTEAEIKELVAFLRTLAAPAVQAAGAP